MSNTEAAYTDIIEQRAAEESATAGEKYDVYLSFPGKKEAEEWLAENGYDARFKPGSRSLVIRDEGARTMKTKRMKLSDMNPAHYNIGLSEDYETSITEAHRAGADSVTTEFFCMESRANEQLKARYAEMSEICKFDIWKFYMAQSKQSGYKRLSKAIKTPIIYKMRDFAHSLGLRFHVSDAACRECNDACNCCGVPPEWGVSQTGHIGNAIIIAREKGEVRFSDISDPMGKYFDFSWVKACGFNTGSNRARALLYDTTMAQWLRANWNNVKASTSPAKAYGGILTPIGRDENNDVIYKYTPERGNTHGGEKEQTAGNA